MNQCVSCISAIGMIRKGVCFRRGFSNVKPIASTMTLKCWLNVLIEYDSSWRTMIFWPIATNTRIHGLLLRRDRRKFLFCLAIHDPCFRLWNWNVGKFNVVLFAAVIHAIHTQQTRRNVNVRVVTNSKFGMRRTTTQYKEDL